MKFHSLLIPCQQVETIGDAYMVVAGMLETSSDHAYALTTYAFSIREAARGVTKPTDNTPLAVSACVRD